jgi:hypothetical protein
MRTLRRLLLYQFSLDTISMFINFWRSSFLNYDKFIDIDIELEVLHWFQLLDRS